MHFIPHQDGLSEQDTLDVGPDLRPREYLQGVPVFILVFNHREEVTALAVIDFFKTAVHLAVAGVTLAVVHSAQIDILILNWDRHPRRRRSNAGKGNVEQREVQYPRNIGINPRLAR